MKTKKLNLIFTMLMIISIVFTSIAAAPAPAFVAEADPPEPEEQGCPDCGGKTKIECTDWSPCSATCGGGEKTKTCVKYRKTCFLIWCWWEEVNRWTKTEACNTHACPVEEECPTKCGYPGGTVMGPNGQPKTCPATPDCPPLGECPQYCGYAGGDEIDDGQGGKITCEATEPCNDCPTYPGYPGGDKVGDGEGGWIICPSIFDPNYDNFPYRPDCIQCKTDTGDMTADELAEQLANVFYRFDTNIADCENQHWEYPDKMYYNGLVPGINGWTTHLEYGWRIYAYFDQPFYAVNYGIKIPAVQGIDGRWRVYMTGEDPENPIDKNVFFMMGSAEAGKFDWADFSVEKRLDSDARYDDGLYVPIITQTVPYFMTDIQVGNVLHKKDGGPSNAAYKFLVEVIGLDPAIAEELVKTMWKEDSVAIPGME